MELEVGVSAMPSSSLTVSTKNDVAGGGLFAVELELLPSATELLDVAEVLLLVSVVMEGRLCSGDRRREGVLGVESR